MRPVGCIVAAACAMTTAWLVVREGAHAERAAPAAEAAFPPLAANHATSDLVQFAGGTIRVDFNAQDFAPSRHELID